jgi:hypothetical protein
MLGFWKGLSNRTVATSMRIYQSLLMIASQFALLIGSLPSSFGPMLSCVEVESHPHVGCLYGSTWMYMALFRFKLIGNER